jgi:hypothetical protein
MLNTIKTKHIETAPRLISPLGDVNCKIGVQAKIKIVNAPWNKPSIRPTERTSRFLSSPSASLKDF